MKLMKTIGILIIGLIYTSCNNNSNFSESKAQIEHRILDSLKKVKDSEEAQKQKLEQENVQKQQESEALCESKIKELNKLFNQQQYHKKNCDDAGITGYFQNEQKNDNPKMTIPYNAITGIKTVIYNDRMPTTLIQAFGQWRILESYTYLYGFEYTVRGEKEKAEEFERENKEKTNKRMEETVQLVKEIVQCKTGNSI